MATNSTFPDEVTVDDFGAPYVDFDPVVDPKKELPAEQYNTLVANVVALTNVMPLFWISVDSSGAYVAGGWSLTSAAASALTPSKTGTGTYVVAFPSEQTKHPTDPETASIGISMWGLVTPLSASARISTGYFDGANEYYVYTFNAAGVAADSAFLLTVYKSSLCQSEHGAILSRSASVDADTRKSKISTTASKPCARLSSKGKAAKSRAKTSSSPE
jgi:hypothetical protein